MVPRSSSSAHSTTGNTYSGINARDSVNVDGEKGRALVGCLSAARQEAKDAHARSGAGGEGLSVG